MEGFIDLFVQDNTEGKKPHFKGFIKINGERFEFACWPAKSGKRGVYSGKVKPAQERNQAPQEQSPGGYLGLDDDIPFAPCL